MPRPAATVLLQRHGRRDLVQHLDADLACSHFAQRDDRGLVAVGVDERRCARRDLARPVGGGERQLEAIGNPGKYVVDGDAGHVRVPTIRGSTARRVPSRGAPAAAAP